MGIKEMILNLIDERANANVEAREAAKKAEEAKRVEEVAKQKVEKTNKAIDSLLKIYSYKVKYGIGGPYLVHYNYNETDNILDEM